MQPAQAIVSTQRKVDPVSKLTPTAIAFLVEDWPDPVTAVAVVLGESGGDPNARNVENGNVDRGLWQISSKWHPEVTDEAAFDVNASTAAAFRISSSGTDFNPWHATRSANFAGHLATAEQAVADLAGERADPDSGGRSWYDPRQITDAVGRAADIVTDPVGVAGDAVGLALSPITNLAGGLGKILAVLTSADTWKRAGYVLAGIALLAVAYFAIFGKNAVAGGMAFAESKTGGAVDLDDAPVE